MREPPECPSRDCQPLSRGLCVGGDTWIEAIAIAKEFNIDFTSKYHRRFLKDILGLYSVNDLEQIECLQKSSYLIDGFQAVHEFQAIAYSQPGASQKLVDGRCSLVDAVIDDLRLELSRFHTDNFAQDPGVSEAIAKILGSRGLRNFFVSGATCRTNTH